MNRMTVMVGAGVLAAVWGTSAGEEPVSQPAPVNEFRGMQEREEIYQFTERAAVVKEGGRIFISFASKGKCDVTVTILDKDGKIVRHLASGVLGSNAPHPFQQNSLSQKIEWDGLKDDFSKADTVGCKVKVSLGIRPVFERNIGWDPYSFPLYEGDARNKKPGKALVGTASDGTIYIALAEADGTLHTGKVYDRNGKYKRTFWPVAAEEVDKVWGGMGYRFATTKWGDKVLITGCWSFDPCYDGVGVKVKSNLNNMLKRMKELSGADPVESVRPVVLPSADAANGGIYWMRPYMAVDATREEIYAGMGAPRFDGRTGRRVADWRIDSTCNDMDVGPDGLFYVRVGDNGGGVLMRLDHTGKFVPFENPAFPYKASEHIESAPQARGEFADKPLLNLLSAESSNVHQKGMDISPGGFIVARRGDTIPDVSKVDLKDPETARLAWTVLPFARPKDRKMIPTAFKQAVGVWDKQGQIVCLDAIENMPGNRAQAGHGVRMDRDGNIYLGLVARWPDAKAELDGVPGFKERPWYVQWGGVGSLVKFRGRGGKYPVGRIGGQPVSQDSIQLFDGQGRNPVTVSGGLWAYGGLTRQGNVSVCSCMFSRFEVDAYSRVWIPASHLCSMMLLDANGNRIARLGRYGNVDDSEVDIKEKQGDGLRFVYPGGVGISDTAMYVFDQGSTRILKAALTYAAEEMVQVP